MLKLQPKAAWVLAIEATGAVRDYAHRKHSLYGVSRDRRVLDSLEEGGAVARAAYTAAVIEMRAVYPDLPIHRALYGD